MLAGRQDPEPDRRDVRAWMEHSLRKRDRKASAGSLVMLGDSQTQGFTPDRIGRVTVLGLGGDRSDQVRERSAQYRSIAQARAILVQAGINDLIQSREPDRIAADMRETVEGLPRSIPAYVTGIFPVAERVAGRNVVVDVPNSTIRTLNARLAALCAEGRCTFIDVAAMGDGNGLLAAYDAGDGIHLSRAGYAAWEAILLAAIPVATRVR